MNNVKGIPEELWVRVSRKRSDGDYGSFGVEAELKVNLANVQDLNLDDTFDAVDAWLTAAVAGSMKAKTAPEALPLKTELSEAPPPERVAALAAGVPPSLASEPPPPPPTESIPQPPGESPKTLYMPPVTSSLASEADEAYVTLKNPHIARTDDNRAKIFGQTEEHKWTRWGVNLWHEVLDAAVEGAPSLKNWREWPQCKATSTGFPDGEGSNRYLLPDGLQEAIVLMKFEDGKWKPDKVVELR